MCIVKSWRQSGWASLSCSFLPTRVFGSQNLTTVKLKGVGESFKKYPNYESKGIKAHFNLDESGVLSLDRVSPEGDPVYQMRAQPHQPFPKHEKRKGFWGWVNLGSK